jgi:hypothetical protein
MADKIGRRHVVKVLAGTALSTSTLSSGVSAQTKSSDLKNFDSQNVYDHFNEKYGHSEAKVITNKWDKYRKQVVKNKITRETAHDNLTEDIQKYTTKAATDYQEYKKNSKNSEDSIHSESSISDQSISVSAADWTSLSTTKHTDTNKYGTAQTGARLLGSYVAEANCISVGYGDGVAWAERGDWWSPPEDGQYNLSCTYYRNGSTAGTGSASINLFADKFGTDGRLSETVESGQYTGDTVTKITQLGLDSSKTYKIGLRIQTEVNGFGEYMFADYFTGGQEVRIDELKIQSAY